MTRDARILAGAAALLLFLLLGAFAARKTPARAVSPPLSVTSTQCVSDTFADGAVWAQLTLNYRCRNGTGRQAYALTGARCEYQLRDAALAVSQLELTVTARGHDADTGALVDRRTRLTAETQPLQFAAENWPAVADEWCVQYSGAQFSLRVTLPSGEEAVYTLKALCQ